MLVPTGCVSEGGFKHPDFGMPGSYSAREQMKSASDILRLNIEKAVLHGD